MSVLLPKRAHRPPRRVRHEVVAIVAVVAVMLLIAAMVVM